jgi:hypothetical protein
VTVAVVVVPVVVDAPTVGVIPAGAPVTEKVTAPVKPPLRVTEA